MMGLAICACTPEAYDDTAIKEQIDNLDDRLTKVEEDLATLELNVAAMKTLAEALKTGKYIESVTSLEDGTGYTITFSDETTIVIKNGEKGDKGETGDKGDKGDTGAAGTDGIDGVTPTVAVKEVDGVLYWFINGTQGPAVYEEAPTFKSEDGKLYVIYPDGTREFIGALTGVSIFDDVHVNKTEGTVTFILLGEGEEEGDSFVLPLAEPFALELDTTVPLVNNATAVDIPYTVKGSGEATVVDVLAFGCKATVEKTVIKVTEITAGAQLLVFADNGEGKTSIKKVVFEAESESFTVESVDYSIPAEGGEVTVKGVSNIDFEVVIPEEATWLTQVPVKSAFTLTFAAAENKTAEPRTAEVDFVHAGTKEVLKTVVFSQAAAEVMEPAVFAERVWGLYSSWDVKLGLTDCRNITMDDQYIYVPQNAAGTPVIKAVSISDPSVVKDVNVTGVGTEGETHAMSCVRMLPTANGDVLMACNLTEGGDNFTFYIWHNGIDNEPGRYVVSPSGRRLGDKFIITGTWEAGEVYCKDYNTSNIVRYTLGSGDVGSWRGPVASYASGRYDYTSVVEDKNCIGSAYVYPGTENAGTGVVSSYLLTSTSNGYFLNDTGAWTGTDLGLAMTHGYNFFTVGDKKYIAYVAVDEDTLGGCVKVVADPAGTPEGVLEALQNQEVLFEAPIQHATDSDVDSSVAASHSTGDCIVREINGEVYMAAMIQHVGLSLFKLN